MNSEIISQSDKTLQQAQTLSNGFNPDEFIIPELTRQDIIDLKEVFDDFDLDSDGIISPLELRAAMARYDIRASKRTVFHIISQWDKDESGDLDFDTFLKLAIGKRPAEEDREFIRCFRNYDRTKKGHINKDDLRRLAVKNNEKPSDKQLDYILEKFSSVNFEGEKVLSMEDFKNAMTSI